jgi:molecular chaperone IbpA
MKPYDFAPLFRTAIGFERMPSLLDTALRLNETAESYPPYDIEKLGENAYRISIAVAGFAPEELDVEVKEGVLTVTAKRHETEEKDEVRHLYRGIARRGFERRFQLADYVVVKSASLANGLLNIELEREIPEEMKPRKIAIAGAAIEGHASLVDESKPAEKAA